MPPGKNKVFAAVHSQGKFALDMRENITFVSMGMRGPSVRGEIILMTPIRTEKSATIIEYTCHTSVHLM
jgi:hypothetical protein